MDEKNKKKIYFNVMQETRDENFLGKKKKKKKIFVNSKRR